MNEDTEKMINFLSEIRKLHRQQEDLINQVYLQDEVWKTIEEMVCNCFMTILYYYALKFNFCNQS